jgi:hypothetical protein
MIRPQPPSDAIVANIDPHPRVDSLTGTEHGHDGVVGGHHVRGSHTIRHQFIEWLDQIGHIAAPDRLRGSGNLNPSGMANSPANR